MGYPILEFKEGDTHYITHDCGLSIVKIHICGIVDGCMVVYKYHTKWGNNWMYKVDEVRSLSFKIFLNKENNCE